jgi:hypothetical protein
LNQLRQFDNLSDEDKTNWKNGPFSTDHWMRLTDDELSAFRDEILAVVTRWEDREVPDDALDRAPVFFFAHAVPGQP